MAEEIEETTQSVPAASGPSNPLYLERTGVRQYVARNARGAEILVGDGPGRFSPGDLLKLALAGCNAMSSDARFAAVLGDDFAQISGVSAEYDEAEDRFTSMEIELLQDLSALSEEETASLLRRAEAAIERHCTIAHTISHPVPHTLHIASEQVR